LPIPALTNVSYQGCWRFIRPHSKSKLSQRRSFSWSAWYFISRVLKAFPGSSVWISWAAGLVRRIVCIDNTTARHWWIKVCRNVLKSRPCGYQWPYSPENLAVVSGSLMGVYWLIHG